MKKLTAIVLALVIALSVAVTAFAASTYQCPYCFEVVEGEKEYNDHLSKTCPVVGSDAAKQEEIKKQTCPNGCNASFAKEEDYKKHLEICPNKPEETFADKVEAFLLDFTIFDAIGPVMDLLGKLDGPSILVTIIDLLEKAVTAIIGAI